MTQKEKQLLIKDLCARLPYYPKCEMIDELRVVNNDKDSSYISTLFPKHIELFSYHNNFTIKPYLRPLSSMTRKERSTYITLLAHGPASYIVAWLDANHFDHRVNKEGDSLIDLGLAIEVTEDNNPYRK